jgi:HEAT repeat protein
MSECDFMKESMPLLLSESLDPVRREQAHSHIERCPVCGEEWNSYKNAWAALGDLPELEVPGRVKERFLASIGESTRAAAVVPFYRRTAVRWMAQAAAVVVMVGGSYYAGHRMKEVQLAQTPATINSVAPARYSIAESRVLPAAAVSPTIEGRPDIQNVSFFDSNPNDKDISVSFDITSHVTVTGRPTDKSMVRLLRYVLENEDQTTPSRSRAIDWVRAMYSRPGNADPEIAEALGHVLRNDEHQGVRIKAVETLNGMGASAASDTRQALIDALKSDPNPAVRIKAVEALANLARSGATLDPATLETLRQKAMQNDENVYVRVKAAEALSSIHP